MLDTEIKIVWEQNCNYSCKKLEHKSQNSNMDALNNPHFVIKNRQMIKTKIWTSWETTWHFATSPMGNGIWRTTTEITYWGSVTTQSWVVLKILLHAIGMEFLHFPFLRPLHSSQLPTKGWTETYFKSYWEPWFFLLFIMIIILLISSNYWCNMLLTAITESMWTGSRH